MKILVTGAKGQLGQELCETLSLSGLHEVVGYDHEEMDIRDWQAVKNTVLTFKPDFIVNGAAYTNVDGCETDYKGAHSVNALGAMHMARAAALVDAKLLHISTDFVFDGEKQSTYFEYDATNPLSVYGKTKLAGEWAVRNEWRKHFIIRTSWLYGKYGNNFVKTMLKLGSERDRLEVVTDQVGSPTYVTDLIVAIQKLMETDSYGTYHFSNKGSCSWNEFARAIFELAGMDTQVGETTSEAFKRPAQRPAYSVMDTSMIESVLGIEIAEWKVSLKNFLKCEKKIVHRGMII